jgi:hypothetical protein
MESALNFDPWTEIEEKALRAFSSYANRSAPGLVATLRRAVHYGKIDQNAREIVIDRRAFLFGLLSHGLQDNPSASFGNTATWVANSIVGRAGSAILSTVRDGITGTDQVLKAHDLGMRVVASRSMTSAAALAASYARRTVERDLADLRHFFSAFVENPSNTISDFADIGWTPRPNDVRDLQRELYDRIAKNPEKGEDLNAWSVILHVNDLSPESGDEPRPPRLAPTEVSGFTSDRAETFGTGSDPLELLSDVKAFARLICLEQAEPPLSIGLFGGWGSGKSTFMQLLEEEIDVLTSKIRGAAKPMAAARTPNNRETAAAPTFIRNVVQVRFNAWHFADANLWASLTAEFFDQLRAGGFARSGKAIHTRLVERVNAHVHTLSSEAANARQTLLASEVALRTAQKARDKAVAEVEKTPGHELKQTMIDAVTKSFEAHKADLFEMGQRTYHDNPVKDIENFLDLSKRLQTANGQLGVLVRFVFARGWRASLAVAGLAAVLGGPLLMWLGHPTTWQFQLDALGIFSFLAGVGAFARSVLPGVRIIGKLIEGTSSFAANLDGKLEGEIKKVAQAEEALQRAAAETEARRAAADRAGKALARYVDPKLTVANPPRLLRFMLEDDPDTRALEKEIGLISRVRRLFQAVDEIVQEEKGKDAEAEVQDQRRDPDVPDRIVIYIDDLDRCTPAQVYAVLQAIHLLLAFKLFVVVVGVDVAWVREALARELRSTPNAPSSADDQEKTDIAERKLAIRYLEKIFQLPFWLRRLSSEGNDGGSYGRFVRSLLSRNLAARTPAFTEAGSAARTDRGTHADGERKGPAGGSRSPVTLVDVHGAKSRPEGGDDSGLDEALATVQLTKEEVDFLASAVIGNLSGQEPRTVKRFANIYRIVRARLTAEERGRFLGKSGVPPEYPLVSILIAVETGQPLEVAEGFYAELSSQAGNGPIGEGLDPSILAAFREAQLLRNGAAITRNDCSYWARAVRRYSFNKYV